jgi:O-antigen/teichoic acid export membrane protein
VAVARGAMRTLYGQWSKYVIQLAGLVLMSRLLVPSEIGLFAVLVAITGFVSVLVDSGLSIAALRVPELSKGERSTFWWLNLVIGLLAAAALSLLAPALGRLLSLPEIAAMLPLFSIVFILNGAAIQFKVDLSVTSRFGRLAAIDVASQLVGLGAGVIAALQGWGVWALVAQQLVVSLTALILSTLISGFVPGRPVYTAAIIGTVRLGLATAGTQLINYASASLPAIALGASAGTVQAGYWNRAAQLVSLPLQQLVSPLTKVAVPALARRGPESDGSVLVQIQMALAYLLCGALSLTCIFADPLVAIVLGPGWQPAIPVLQILSIGAMFQVVGYPYYWIAVARGHMKVLALAELPGRLIMITGAAFAAAYGSVPVAISYVGGTVLVWLGTTLVFSSLLGTRRWPLFVGAIVPITVWGGTAGAVLLVQGLIGVNSVIGGVLTAIPILVGLFGCALIFPPVRRDVRVMARSVSVALRKGLGT